ncbi:MAG: DedA family protein [Candidatus Kapabacteria bacterium]|nr:DedA family protein [Candidatus Kapabacteria bacterium]
MLEQLVLLLQGLPPLGILVVAFLICYIENIFPPSPSDVVLVFIGTFVGLGVISFPVLAIIATIGSTTGFLTMYWLGNRFGLTLVNSGKFPFLTKGAIEKAEKVFAKLGNFAIVINRFLPGTRAVISFAAGVVHLPIVITTVLCSISALLWNCILIYCGTLLGDNWQSISKYLSFYSQITTIIVVTGIVGYLIYFFLKRRKTSQSTTEVSSSNEE